MRVKSAARACVSLFRVRLIEGLQYRAAVFSGGLVGTFWCIIECTFYTIFFRYSLLGGSQSAMTLQQTVSYIWISQMTFALQQGGIDNDIYDMINSGNVGVELCRPLDLYFHWFAKNSARKLSGFLLRSLFLLIPALLMPAGFRLGTPASAAGFACFLISLAAAFLLNGSYGMLVTSVRLNITWGDGPTYMLFLLGMVLSGGYLPLRLWPDFMQTFLKFQPFAGSSDIPIQFYVGTLAPAELPFFLGVQLIWCGAFILLGRQVMSRRLRTVIVQGG